MLIPLLHLHRIIGPESGPELQTARLAHDPRRPFRVVLTYAYACARWASLCDAALDSFSAQC